MPANCGAASVFRATQVSPLRFGGGIPRRYVGWRAVMDVGAPFMTPGADTAQPVRGVVRGGVRGDAGQLRRCVGLPGDTSVAPTLRGARPRRCDGLSGDTSVAPTFGGGILRRCVGYPGGDGRRGAIYDARCRNGTTRPRHCARRCVRCFRPIAALRRLSGRHKCRPYVWRRYPAALRRLFGRHKCRPYVWRRYPAALRRLFGRHKCRPYVLAARVAATLSADALKLSAGLFFLSQ